MLESARITWIHLGLQVGNGACCTNHKAGLRAWLYAWVYVVDSFVCDTEQKEQYYQAICSQSCDITL